LNEQLPTEAKPVANIEMVERLSLAGVFVMTKKILETL